MKKRTKEDFEKKEIIKVKEEEKQNQAEIPKKLDLNDIYENYLKNINNNDNNNNTWINEFDGYLQLNSNNIVINKLNIKSLNEEGSNILSKESFWILLIEKCKFEHYQVKDIINLFNQAFNYVLTSKDIKQYYLSLMKKINFNQLKDYCYFKEIKFEESLSNKFLVSLLENYAQFLLTNDTKFEESKKNKKKKASYNIQSNFKDNLHIQNLSNTKINILRTLKDFSHLKVVKKEEVEILNKPKIFETEINSFFHSYEPSENLINYNDTPKRVKLNESLNYSNKAIACESAYQENFIKNLNTEIKDKVKTINENIENAIKDPFMNCKFEVNVKESNFNEPKIVETLLKLDCNSNNNLNEMEEKNLKVLDFDLNIKNQKEAKVIEEECKSENSSLRNDNLSINTNNNDIIVTTTDFNCVINKEIEDSNKKLNEEFRDKIEELENPNDVSYVKDVRFSQSSVNSKRSISRSISKSNQRKKSLNIKYPDDLLEGTIRTFNVKFLTEDKENKNSN